MAGLFMRHVHIQKFWAFCIKSCPFNPIRKNSEKNKGWLKKPIVISIFFFVDIGYYLPLEVYQRNHYMDLPIRFPTQGFWDAMAMTRLSLSFLPLLLLLVQAWGFLPPSVPRPRAPAGQMQSRAVQTRVYRFRWEHLVLLWKCSERISYG